MGDFCAAARGSLMEPSEPACLSRVVLQCVVVHGRLSDLELFLVARVCRAWRRAVVESSSVWEERCVIRFGHGACFSDYVEEAAKFPRQRHKDKMFFPGARFRETTGWSPSPLFARAIEGELPFEENL